MSITGKRVVLVASICAALLVPAASAGAEVSLRATTLEPAGTLAQGVAVGDLDGRNGPDIVTAYYEGGLGVNLNNGDGTFGPTKTYATGCDTIQVELADLGDTSYGVVGDGRIDAAIVCVVGGGNTDIIGRMAGDGAGGFLPPQFPPEFSTGAFPLNGSQELALAPVRGPGLPPIPVFTYLSHEPLSTPQFFRAFCWSYDWSTRYCAPRGGSEQMAGPLVGGVVAQARVFGLGGAKGIIDWGVVQEGTWNSSTRDLAPDLPSTAGNVKSLTIGDLAHDGPDIISASGTCGCGYQDNPAAGIIDVSYGSDAAGVPDQNGTTFPSAPGILNIATGDFDVDGNNDVIGTYYEANPQTLVSTDGIFVQPGNGAGGLGSPQLIPLAHSETRSTAPIRVADLDGNGADDAVAVIDGKVTVLLNQKAPAPKQLSPGGAITGPGSNGGQGPGSKFNPLAGISGLVKKVRLDRTGGAVFGTVSNPPTASVGLLLTVPPAPKPKAKGATASAAGTRKGATKKSVVIGKANIVVPTGKKLPLGLKLNGKGRARVAHKSLGATLTITAVATDGTKATKVQKVTLQPPKPAKKKH